METHYLKEYNEFQHNNSTYVRANIIISDSVLAHVSKVISHTVKLWICTNKASKLDVTTVWHKINV